MPLRGIGAGSCSRSHGTRPGAGLPVTVQYGVGCSGSPSSAP